MIDKFRRFRKAISNYYYVAGFNPFSSSFDLTKVKEYSAQLSPKNYGREIDALAKFEVLNDFHKKLFTGLELEVNKVASNKEDFIRSLIALANEQYFAIKREMSENLPDNNASALDFKNVTVDSEKFPDNPQVLNGALENSIEYLNLLIQYAKRKKFNSVLPTLEAEKVVKGFEAVFKNANEYNELRHHFETCLSGSGNMHFEKGKASFTIVDSNLHLSQILMEVIIENNSQFSFFSFLNQLSKGGEFYLQRKEHDLILDQVSFADGKWDFMLRARENQELVSLYIYEVLIKDYYPHITEMDLSSLEDLTLRDLLHLSQGMSDLAYGVIQVLGSRKTENEIESINENYAPLLKKDFISRYLIAISGLSQKQIDKYLEIQTNSWSDNFYAKPLIRIGDSFVFPFLPVAGYNYFFLLDHWLEVAGISLDERGIKFQEIVKEELKTFKDRKYNKYRVIEDDKIWCNDNGKPVMEEVDLIIELKDILLIGEVKCIKYPMSERDCFDGLNNRVDEGIKQLIRKERYLVKNAEEIKRKYKFDTKKKIVKVIVLNYPVYTCYSVKGIPIVDYKTLLAYFQSSGYSLKSMNDKEMDVVSSGKYYTSEDTFNSNLEEYLINAPTHSYFKNGMDLRELKYELPYLQLEVSFNDFRKR